MNAGLETEHRRPSNEAQRSTPLEIIIPIDESVDRDRGDEHGSSSISRHIQDQEAQTTSKLCDRCQWILHNWSKYEDDHNFKFPHHEDLFQFQKAALGLCALCYQFWRYSFAQAEDVEEQFSEMTHGLHDAPGALVTVTPLSRPPHAPLGHSIYLSLRFFRPTTDSDEDDALSEDGNFQVSAWFEAIMIPAKSLDVASFTPQDHVIKGSTKDSLDLAQFWLNDCRRLHKNCNKSIEAFIPTRVISTDATEVRLCLGTQVLKPLQYATLSHCWGKMKFATLLKSNIELFQSRIPEEALSQTIKDAITIARYMGFAYLWIDTLCIVQDDINDWKWESSLMSFVYGGSGLNIAASGASDGSVGCFFERPQHWKCQAEIEVKGQQHRYDFVSSSLNTVALTRMPLMSRGWALQERLLAARTLHFTTTEVFWECHHRTACETFPEGLPWQCRISNDALAKQPLSLSMWSWIVDQYSHCQLTYVIDKFVAISGLARNIQKQTRDWYVAGMWRDKLESQLCWRAWAPSSRSTAGPYIAPTWSWASVNSFVDMREVDAVKTYQKNGTASVKIKILDVRIQLSGIDPFGPLSAATLRLSCSMLLHVGLQKGPEDVSFMILNDERLKCTIELDVPLGPNKEAIHEAYALPIFGKYFARGTTGLLLRATGEGRGIYERVGLFQFLGGSFNDSFESVVAKVSHTVQPEDCFEVQMDKNGCSCFIVHIV